MTEGSRLTPRDPSRSQPFRSSPASCFLFLLVVMTSLVLELFLRPLRALSLVALLGGLQGLRLGGLGLERRERQQAARARFPCTTGTQAYRTCAPAPRTRCRTRGTCTRRSAFVDIPRGGILAVREPATLISTLTQQPPRGGSHDPSLPSRLPHPRCCDPRPGAVGRSNNARRLPRMGGRGQHRGSRPTGARSSTRATGSTRSTTGASRRSTS